MTFLGLFAAIWPASFPPVLSPLEVTVTFPQGIRGRGEPLVTTGGPGDADFLAVRYLDAETAVLVYDVWGMGGPVSAAFALQPGTRRSLVVTMPTLEHVSAFRSREKRPLRVTLDGKPLLDHDVFFHRRQPGQIYFGLNPYGGTIARDYFRGKLVSPAGRVLRGGPEAMFGGAQRAAWLLSHQLGRLAQAILLSVAAGWAAVGLVAMLAAIRPRVRVTVTPPDFPRNTVACHGWFLVTAAACMVVFVAVVTGGTFHLIFPESFGNFYDYQALSLLHGHLDVPPEALSGEAFIFEGKTYGYFGPTPALLRIPFVAANIAFGQLSRAYLTADYVAALVAAYSILIYVARLGGGRDQWPSRFATVLFTAITGLGTTLLFLASRAYIYHEAILCGVAFALWASYFSLRYFEERERGWWVGALVCGILAVHARPPVGLFGLSMLGCSALGVAYRASVTADAPFAARFRAAFKPFGIGLLAGVGVLSFNAVSYLKFRSFEGAPLRYHVAYNAGRLATIENRNFHLRNFAFNFDGYIWRPDFTVRRTFPYFFLQSENSQKYPEAKLDLVEPGTALPYTMPALVLLAWCGGGLAYLRWPGARGPLAVIAGATLPMALALFTAVAMSQRYTADFCPALLLAGAFGLQALGLLKPRWRRVMHVTLAILAVASALITLAITVHYEGEAVWGVPEDVRLRYRTFRKTIDGYFGVTEP